MRKNLFIIILLVLSATLGVLFWQERKNEKSETSLSNNSLPISNTYEEKDRNDSSNEKYIGYRVINEWGLKYKTTKENENIFYKYDPITALSENQYLSGQISFLYAPEPKIEEDGRWASCRLPGISRHTQKPAFLGATPDNLKKIGDYYYLFSADLHEPCHVNGTMISGEEENKWNTRRQSIRTIFDSLELK